MILDLDSGQCRQVKTDKVAAPKNTNPVLSAELGATIFRHRQSLCLSQVQLATAAGVRRTYLSDIERGLRNISVTALCQIAQAMSMTGSQLLAEAENLPRRQRCSDDQIVVTDRAAAVESD